MNNPVPVVIYTINEFGECDKWFNLDDTICFDVLIIWTYRGMLENMYDYFNRVVEAGHQVDVVLPGPQMKYTIRTKEELDNYCCLLEMVFG